MVSDRNFKLIFNSYLSYFQANKMKLDTIETNIKVYLIIDWAEAAQNLEAAYEEKTSAFGSDVTDTFVWHAAC